MTDPKSFLPSDPDVLDVLAVFQEELARAAERPDVLGTDPALWRRFAGYYQGLARLPRRVRRTLRRQWRRSLGGLALLLALGQAPALAATINVDGVNCTLIDAITAANNNGFAGGCTAGSGADTIVLPPNSIHTLTEVNNTTYNGPNGLPVVTSTITIDGNGSTVIREDGASDFRILTVRNNGGNLTLQETRVTGGRTPEFNDGGGVSNNGTLSLVSSTVYGNLTLRYGGGVSNGFGGTMHLTNSIVSGNTAQFLGGGIFNRNILTVTNSTVFGNSATQDGGGLLSRRSLTILNSTVFDNTATQHGGGLQISSGTATVDKSTVSGNLARENGGGINNSGTLTLTNSTVSGNSATQDGGGFRTSGNTTVTTSTISGNTASQDGGGVHHADRTLFLNETLISGNTAVAGPEQYNAPSASSTINANNSNLFGYGGAAGVTNFTPGANDLVPGVALTAVLSTALADNGGPTRTHALVAGSPAIDAGGNCAPTTDQRGIPRPQGADTNSDGFADCDIGAFEVGVALPPLPPPSPPPPTPPPPPVEAAPTNPAVAIPCTGSACNVRISCNLAESSGSPCTNRIRLFVRAAAARLSGDGLAKAPRWIRFAFGVANIPPGETENVRLRLTSRGKRLVRSSTKKKFRGVLEIRNAARTAVSNTPIRIRIR